MAVSNQLLSLIVLNQAFRPEIVRLVNRKAIGLRCVPWVAGEGQNAAWVCEGAGMQASMYLESATSVPNIGSDAQYKAILNWSQCMAAFGVSGLAEATAATSTSPQGNMRLWARNMVNAGGALASLINTQFYTGSGTAPNLVGLDVQIGTQNNTVAGLDRSVITALNPSVFTGVSTLTEDMIRGDLAAIYIACGERPDVALVHPNVLKAIGALFDGSKFYMIPTTPVQDVASARGMLHFDGGVGSMSINGCTFIEDKDCPDNSIYYLNTTHVRFEYLPMDLSQIPGLDDEVINSVPTDDGYGLTPLGMRLEMLAKNADVEQCFLKSYLQLIVDKPSTCGKRSGLTA